MQRGLQTTCEEKEQTFGTRYNFTDKELKDQCFQTRKKNIFPAYISVSTSKQCSGYLDLPQTSLCTLFIGNTSSNETFHYFLNTSSERESTVSKVYKHF